MNIAFRVDASSQIGTGHFVRCMTLADELKKRGIRTRFVSRHLPEHLRGMLMARGHEFAPLDGVKNDMAVDELVHAHWLGVSQMQDALDSIRVLSDEKWDWLVVDHYALDSRWELMLRQVASKTLVIDDIADRRHDCDVLLDQNFYADMEARYAGKVSSRCQLLLGPRYALLRDEFRQLRKQVKPRNARVGRVLVFFGGIDVDNYTGCAIKALSDIGIADLHVDVVIGAQHPCREQIKAECTERGFVCHIQTDKMAELMAAADLAIGAGGSATWERCCLGLPTFAICTADNQQKQVADAAREGLLYAPEIHGDVTQSIRRHIKTLAENSYLRQFISSHSMKIVNGHGMSRVVASLGVNDIEMRMARHDDSEKLFQWRNHPSIREASRNTNKIDWESHRSWFAAVLDDSERMLLIGEHLEAPVGVVRFDRQNDEAEISIYVIPDKASSGFGQGLLQSAEQWLAANHPEIRKVRAHVLGANERSQKLFSGAGYQIESTCYLKRLY